MGGASYNLRQTKGCKDGHEIQHQTYQSGLQVSIEVPQNINPREHPWDHLRQGDCRAGRGTPTESPISLPPSIEKLKGCSTGE